MNKKSLTSIFILIIIVLTFLWLADHFDFDFMVQDISQEKNKSHHIESVHAAVIIILTFILACVAWIQLAGIKKAENANFLFEIDKRFGNKYIMRARFVIHEFYLQSKRENPGFIEQQHRERIGELINNISADPNRIEDYICLLTFLNFLESISLLTNRGYISLVDINDLMNQSMDFFYTIFSPRIYARRSKYADQTFYCEFDKLNKKIIRRKKCCFPKLLDFLSY